LNSEIRLENANKQIKDFIEAENSYKASAWLIYAILFIIAFIVSLGNADFDFSRILKAQFWIDFIVTFGGGMLLKYAFGKWGDQEGHKNPQIINSIEEINQDHIEIKEKRLLKTYKNYIDLYNRKKKLTALKNKTFVKLRKHEKSKKWQKIKENIILYESILYDKVSEDKKEEYEKELYDKNFNLESFKIKYNELTDSTLQTGFSNKEKDQNNLNYNEIHELFGKQIYLNILTFTITIILAVTSVALTSVSLITLFVFFTRIGVYTMNAYLGYSIAKSGVERIKLNKLKRIHEFLSAFIEVNTKPESKTTRKVIKEVN